MTKQLAALVGKAILIQQDRWLIRGIVCDTNGNELYIAYSDLADNESNSYLPPAIDCWDLWKKEHVRWETDWWTSEGFLTYKEWLLSTLFPDWRATLVRLRELISACEQILYQQRVAEMFMFEWEEWTRVLTGISEKITEHIEILPMKKS
jgi:hypothetical protein